MLLGGSFLNSFAPSFTQCKLLFGAEYDLDGMY